MVTFAANKEGAGSEQGRLVRDALEFSRPTSDHASQQPCSAKTDSLVDYKPGQVLGGKYTVVETVGRGKAGVTYKVSDCCFPWCQCIYQCCFHGHVCNAHAMAVVFGLDNADSRNTYANVAVVVRVDTCLVASIAHKWLFPCI